MGRLDGQIRTTGTEGVPGSTTVRTGVRYEERSVLLNPEPPATGLSTEPRTVALHGVRAVDGTEANTRAFWNGTRRNYTTREVRLRPAYNEIDLSPVEVTRVGTYRVQNGTPVAVTEQTTVTNNSITLVTVAGNVSADGYSTTVTTRPVTRSRQSVPVTGPAGGTFTLTLPVAGTATAWNDTDVADSLRAIENVEVVTPLAGEGAANVTLDGDAVYELRLARVTVAGRDDDEGPGETEPAYVVATEGNGTALSTGQRVTLATQVRDRYNNPVSGVEVRFATSNGTFAGGATSRTVTTTAEGRAAVQFEPNDQGNVTVNATVTGLNNAYNTTRFRLAV